MAQPDPNAYDTLTFDCYGTLIDWGAGLTEFLQPLLLRHDAHVIDDFLLEFFAANEPQAQLDGRAYRHVLREVLRRLGARLGFTPTDDALEAFAASPGEWPAFADAPAALERLAERYALVVVSNIDNALFAKSAERLGVAFSHVITAEDVGAYKPDERMFAAARAKVGENARILHVAQSLYHDIAPATALGWETAWIKRERNAAKPADATPTFTFDSLAELADALCP